MHTALGNFRKLSKKKSECLHEEKKYKEWTAFKSDLSSATLHTKRRWNNTFKVLMESDNAAEILCPNSYQTTSETGISQYARLFTVHVPFLND